MTSAEKLMALANALYAARGSWSANDVIRMAAIAGLRVRRSDALTALKNGPPGRLAGRKKVVPDDSVNATLSNVARHAQSRINTGREPLSPGARDGPKRRVRSGSEPITTAREPLSRSKTGAAGTTFKAQNAGKSSGGISPQHPPKLELDRSAFSSEPTVRSRSFATRKKARARGKTGLREPEPAWLQTLREQAKTLDSRVLSVLTVVERRIASRYLAYRFGNCNKSERGNHLKATRLATDLVGLGTHRIYGDLTFRQLVNLGDRVREDRGGTPFYSAWLAVGAADVKQSHHALGPMWVRLVQPLQLALEIAAL